MTTATPDAGHGDARGPSTAIDIAAGLSHAREAVSGRRWTRIASRKGGSPSTNY